MSNQNERQVIRIKLTQDQKDRLKAKTGKDADVIEFTGEELEARIAPLMGQDLNHNETLLVD